jgi:hypothetical protein
MILLENLIIAQLAMKIRAFYETKKFLPCSKEPAIDPYPEADESSTITHF